MNELQTWTQEFFGTSDVKEATKMYEEQRKECYPEGAEEEFTKMSFPYYAPDPSLPPLPTPEDLEEIRASANKKNDKGYNFNGNLFRVNDVYAVKYQLAGPPTLFQVL